MAASVEQFGKALAASGLMTADEVKALWNALPADDRPADGLAFARLLTAAQKLTEFQAQQLLAGRGMRLVLGDYAILQEIGAGGMGQVYQAMHRRMHRIVALKVMSAAAMKDDASVKRFQREVRAAARLEHPNIVTAYASGEDGNVKYLVMQFVDGGDLSSLVKRNGPVEIERAVDYVLQTAQGLAYAHGEGVIHRDVKPANLLLDKKGAIKILDMGLARIDSGDDGLTATEQVMGTVDYMSPEQAANTKSADARADIYSLGCTLWYLLTAKKLYEASTMIGRLMAHRDAPLPSLVKTRDDAPWPLEQALHKMIAKRPDDRYQTMNDVVAALAPFGPSSDGSSSGIGSSITRASSSHNAELASFLQGTRSQIATSQPRHTTDATAPLTTPDVGTDAKRGVLPPRRPAAGHASARSGETRGRAPRRSQAIALFAVGGGLVVAAAVWFSMKRDKPETAVTMPSPSLANVVARPVAVPAASPRASGPTAAEKLESTKYVWTVPENLGRKVNDGTNNRGPTLTADQLCLIATADRPSQSDLLEFRRASVNDPWGAAVVAVGSDNENNPCLSADGLQLLFASSSGQGPVAAAGWDLWIRRRANRDASWDTVQNLGAVVNTPSDEGGPALSPDGLTLAFHSARSGGHGGQDIWISRRASLAAPFGTPENLGPTINSYRTEMNPHFVADDGTLLFERDGELWITFRNSTGAVGAIVLSNQTEKFDEPWLSPDGGALYFSRDSRSGGCGGHDVWLTRRVPRDSPEAARIPSPVEPEPLPPIKPVPFAGHGYQWVPETSTWLDADARARAMGGHLVAITSAAESEWLEQTLLAQLPAERMIWAGGIKDPLGIWKWTTGESMDYTHWFPGEGNDGFGSATGVTRRAGDDMGWSDWHSGSFAVAQGGPLQGQSRCAGFVVEWNSPTPTLKQP